MRGKLAPVLGVVAALGIVGGVVGGSMLSHPVSKPAQVQLVQPAAQTVTVSPSPTTTVAPVPVKVAKAAPVPAPVQSTQAVAPAPAPVQQKAVSVSADTSTPAPAPAQTTGVSTQATPGQTQPPVIPPNVPQWSNPAPSPSKP